MLRKPLPLLLLVVATVSSLAGVRAQESPLAWVEARYRGALADHAARAQVAEDDFLAAFTPNAQAVWRAARAGPGPRLDGPILDAYFGWGVLPGREVVLDAFALQSGDAVEARVRVDLRVQGVPRRAYVGLERISGAWRIEDIAHSEGDSFLTYERKCAAGLC